MDLLAAPVAHDPIAVGGPAAAYRDGLYLAYVEGRPCIAGLELRYLLTTVLLECNARLTVAQLVEAVAAEGFLLRGRPSKAVSDALRWEVRRGRVLRHARGIYGPGTMPRQTKSRIRTRVRRLRAHVVATRRDTGPDESAGRRRGHRW
jgi:hypothetical protein